MSDILKDDKFSFFIPNVTIAKAEKNSPEAKDGKRYFQGIASTDQKDLEQETVRQSGILYDYFLAHGWFNEDHKTEVEHKVGIPVDARITPAGFWVKGYLLNTTRGDHWWEFLNSLEGNKDRRPGLSVEGRVTRREGKSILSCMVTAIALTASPINTGTYIDVVKALSQERWCVHPWKSLEKACKGCPGVAACSDTLCKEESEIEEKALTTGGMGRTLIPQDLDGAKHVQTYKSLDTDTFSYDEAVQYLQLEKGYSKTTAKALADAIYSSTGMR